ncbi:MAG: hypothetical protein PUB43_01075, partial [Oscillospiraceae bacterium]|nr:hypothetical protein [Oscillospiraceae bacterium]
MKKTIKSTLKKNLCVMMALLMIMTSWVFVAPMKAEAINAGSYDVTLTFNVSNGCDGSPSVNIYYRENNGTGNETNKSVALDCVKDGKKGQQSQTVTVNGWPNHIIVYMNTPAFTSTNVTLNKIQIGSKVIVQNATWTFNAGWGGNTTKNFYAAGGGDNGSASWDWPTPTPTSIVAPGNASMTVDKTSGSVSKYIGTGSVYDQYGVLWYQAPDFTFSGNCPGFSYTTKDNGSAVEVTVTATKDAFVDANNYNVNTGVATATLVTSKGSVSKNTTITVKSPYYYVTFLGSGGAYDEIAKPWCYYNGSVTPPTATPTKARDESYHYAFDGWDVNSEDDYKNITADKTINAKFAATAHKYEGAYKDNGNGTHSRQCTGCDAYGFQGVYEGSESCAAYTTYSTDGSGNHAGSCSKCYHVFSHT